MDSEQAYKPLIRQWMTVAFSIFLLAGILGLLMRYMTVGSISALQYKFVLHAHSHTAILGFGYLFITGSILFLTFRDPLHLPLYKKILWSLLIVSLVMTGSFIYQGYGPISITFSTLMLILSYVFSYHFLKDYKRTGREKGNPLIPTSIYCFLISTLPLWAMGPIMVTFSKTHPLYFLTIQLFLHLQFNGWFTFVVLGLLIAFTKRQGFAYNFPKHGLYLLVIALFLTYFLVVYSAFPKPIFYYLNSIGVSVQVAAYIILLKPLLHFWNNREGKDLWPDRIFQFGIYCLILKVIIQFLVIVPQAATASYNIRNFIVGFIHLIMLGSITLTVTGILIKSEILPKGKFSKIGWHIFLIAFLFTEFIIFWQAAWTWAGKGYIPHTTQILFWSSILLPVSIALILIGIIYEKNGISTRGNTGSALLPHDHPYSHGT